MQRTSVDLMGETREPDKSQDSFQNRTYIRGHDTASRKSHSEVHRDKQGGSEAGITQHRIQHGEILLFDEADRIKGGFYRKKIKQNVGFFSRGYLKKRSQSVNVKHRKISFGDFQTRTNGLSVKKILIEVPIIISNQQEREKQCSTGKMIFRPFQAEMANRIDFLP